MIKNKNGGGEASGGGGDSSGDSTGGGSSGGGEGEAPLPKDGSCLKEEVETAKKEKARADVSEGDGTEDGGSSAGEINPTKAGLSPQYDRLSNLPPELRREIISRIPIDEAIRTSSLSSIWTDDWRLIPGLIIKQDRFPSSEVLKEFMPQYLQARTWVKKLSLNMKQLDGDLVGAVDSWIDILVEKKIKEVELDFDETYQIPNSLFSCSELENILLDSCILSLPKSFCKFEHLSSLSLRRVTVSADDLEKLITLSPKLQVLELNDFTVERGTVSIKSCTIEKLTILGPYRMDLQTPRLTELDFDLMYGYEDVADLTAEEAATNFNMVFGQCSGNIKKITLNSVVLLYLGFSYIQSLAEEFPNLRILVLEFCAKCPLETREALAFLQNASNIENLEIQFTTQGWVRIKRLNCKCLGLKLASFPI